MSTIILKYKINGGIEPEKEHVKLFKNDASCSRWVENVKTDIGANGIVTVSKTVDNRAPRTLKRLMSIPKRKQGKTW